MKKLSWILMMLVLMLTGCAEPAGEQVHDLQFTYREVTLELNTPAAPVIEALGTPKSYTEGASCAFDGVEKTYGYGSFYLVTYDTDGEDRIGKLWFADDSVATREGIYLGAPKAAVEAAYGVTMGEENTCAVERGSSRLTIILEKDAVVSIVYEVI